MLIHLTKPDLTTTLTSLPQLLSQAAYTVLYFYPKDNTPGCTIESKEFTDLLPEFKKLHAQVVGISKDSEKSHCKFITDHTLTLDLISDPDLEVHHEFGTR